MREVWQFIPGYESQYQASNRGRLRSVDRVVPTVSGDRRFQGLVLQPRLNTAGYLCVRLGRGEPVMVHTVVASTFIGPRPAGFYVRHKNGKRTDNRAVNLAYGTPKQNQADRKLHGTYRYGEMVTQALLTERQVRAIKQAIAKGATHRSLGEKYKVSRPAITAIATGRNWSHIE